MRAPRTDIPYVDIGAQHAPLKDEILSVISRVLDEGKFILGDEVEEFEHKFAAMCQAEYAIGLNSGTDALILALRVLGIGPGDEVITVPNSFVASVSCIALVGAKPVFVDAGLDANIDPLQIEKAITKRTKAILPVHLSGKPCEMDTIVEIARKHRLWIVEDCAQAILAEYKGRQVGSFGILGCFSLHPLKTLNACGDAGVITTNDSKLHEELKILRNIGLRTRNDCICWSGNSRLDTLQAAILLVKMQYVQEWTEKRRQNAHYYSKNLVSVSNIQLPRDETYEKSVCHTYVIRTDQRDKLQAYLSENGIGTTIHYPVCIHLTQAGQSLGYPKGSFPTAERQAERILSLPIYQGLTREQLDRVCQTIENFFQERP